MQINPNLTPAENVLALINAANTSQVFNLSQISLGMPNETGSQPPGHNTTVTVSAIEGSGYTGTVDVNYQRIRLDQAVAAPSNTVVIPDAATSTLDTVNAVADHFGLVVGEFALNTAQSTRPSDGVTLEVAASLTPNSSSYLYAGPDVSITLKWNALPPVSLNAVVTQKNLPGFDAVS
ncbi:MULTISPECIES: hypothetical protein [unclassified Caballeronia]|uniref:DUF7941 domain-family protein n=1 Tax=unclassified Caballeronia TaxID=2646786 RepID=UPI0020294E19|nr:MULTISPECIES: hypothetical protein [unclassified Caballeronia]